MGPGQREVWVVFHRRSGAVTRVCLREPSDAETPNRLGPYAVLKTDLSQWAIDHAHQLSVRYGRVVHAPSFGGV